MNSGLLDIEIIENLLRPVQWRRKQLILTDELLECSVKHGPKFFLSPCARMFANEINYLNTMLFKEFLI